MAYCSQVYRGFKPIGHLSGTSLKRGVLLVDAWHVLRCCEACFEGCCIKREGLSPALMII